MELSDEQWARAREVADAKALILTHGDHVRAQDLASLVIEKLFVTDATIDADKIDAYVRTMTRNAYLDQVDRSNAAFRGRTIKRGAMDDSIYAEVAGVFKYQLNSTSPSRKLIRREAQQARAHAYLEILASLPDRQRELVRLAAEGLPYSRIAEELGYANASVVKTTLHRAYRRIREQFDLQYTDYFE